MGTFNREIIIQTGVLGYSLKIGIQSIPID